MRSSRGDLQWNKALARAISPEPEIRGQSASEQRKRTMLQLAKRRKCKGPVLTLQPPGSSDAQFHRGQQREACAKETHGSDHDYCAQPGSTKDLDILRTISPKPDSTGPKKGAFQEVGAKAKNSTVGAQSSKPGDSQYCKSPEAEEYSRRASQQ